MLKKTKMKVGAAIATGLMGFAAIGISVRIIEDQKTNTQINNNIKTSVIKNDNLNTQSKNYSNYLKETTLTQVEGLINQKINQQTEMFATLSTHQTKVLQYQQELKTKANEIVKNIFTKEVSVNNLLNQINKKYNNLTLSEKNFIKSKINTLKFFFKKSQLNEQKMFYGLDNFSVYLKNYNHSQNLSNIKKEQQIAEELQYKLKVVAGVTTAAAIASTAVVVAIWTIPFYGWVAEGFATADTAADWVLTGLAWAQYKQMNNENIEFGNLVANCLNVPLTVGSSIHDLYSFGKALLRLMPKLITKISSVIGFDLATNLAGSFAEPEIAPWLDAAITGFTTFLDTTATTLSSLVIQQTILSELI